MALATLPRDSAPTQAGPPELSPRARAAAQFVAASSTTIGLAILVLYLGAVLARWVATTTTAEPFTTALVLAPMPIAALGWWLIARRMPPALPAWLGLGAGIVVALGLFGVYLLWLVPFTLV